MFVSKWNSGGKIRMRQIMSFRRIDFCLKTGRVIQNPLPFFAARKMLW
jgi:hypothetical protein